MAPYRKLIEEYFSKWEEWLHHGLGERILKRANLLRYSPLAIDFLLIEALEEKEEALALLETCQEHLSPREKGIFLFSKALTAYDKDPDERISIAKEASQLLGNSIAQSAYCGMLFFVGEYRKLLDEAEKGMQLALKEGNLYSLARISALKGSTYASFDMIALMLSEYKRALKFLSWGPWDAEKGSIYYNLGATYLSLGEYEEAEKYLLEDTSAVMGFLHLHKCALLYHRTGRKAEAQKTLEKMQPDPNDPLETLLYEALVVEITEGHSKRLMELLEELMEIFIKTNRFGFINFFKPLLIEVYQKHRQYKKALEFSRIFSRKDLEMLFK